MSTGIMEVIQPGQSPNELMRLYQSRAESCREIIRQTAQNIGGRDHIRVEGWQALAAVSGCTVSIALVESVEGGVRSVAEVKRQSDGTVLASAEGFVGDDETTWKSRKLFARRAMAQTRATSRACRVAFSHLVVLLKDPNLSTTPAEEMDSEPRDQVSSPPPPPPRNIQAGPSREDWEKIAELMDATQTTGEDLERKFGASRQLSAAKAREVIVWLERISKERVGA